MSSIRENLRLVLERIDRAAGRSGRAVAEITLVTVTKTRSVAEIREAIACGVTDIGENYVQEAEAKHSEIGDSVRWHMIGHLQKNKARHAAGAFELIHGIDDRELAIELDRRAAARSMTQPVLVQANLSGEATKSGSDEDGLMPLLTAVAGLPHLDLRGLMIIPPPVDDPELSRPWFRRLRELRDRAASSLARPLPELSMGMTDDFEVAIEEGATLVRIGRAIFGERA
jgi:PLP dependent protein